MLRRRRSAGTIASPIATTAAPAMPPPSAAAAVAAAAGATLAPTPVAISASAPTNPARPIPNTGHRIRLVPHLDSRRSLRFDAIARDLKEGDPPLRIGRFTDRSGLGLAAVNALGSNKLAFKSKVVSRAHAEIWVESGGRFFIKDTKSSSGTFLNHVRLSPANTESRPYQMKDGDILQLGVDYQGGAEDIYKSVKIRIEAGREWQAAPNAFNTNALKNLKTLAVAPTKSTTVRHPGSGGKSQIPDCCICLFGVTIRQALFIAPCSHTFHYKCIRPLLESHHPAFSCPLCRTFADLEEDVEVEPEDGLDDDDDDGADSAVEALQPGSRPLSTLVRDAGLETDVEGMGPGMGGGAAGAARRRGRGEDADEEQLLRGLQEEPDVEMDGVDPRSDGSGEGSGSPGPGEMGEMGSDPDAMEADVDGTVGHGAKRKR
ncbi:hypothetical protein BDZ94DRAFT_1172026 [Collybia nuda]|uniref:SMAD/FHA domain-containing protein n=1 Tax=Collybia nuda TaxID=64659 RepID=A0A9P6CB89_9AGAR|nr:hypothetical protein BDZ94DRAFT_1172026 [Collybia nuda]